MRFAPIALVVLLGGCGAMDPVACKRANWYDLGFRDAIFGILPQDDIYAMECEAHGIKVDHARYRQGFREGFYEAEHRKAGSHD